MHLRVPRAAAPAASRARPRARIPLATTCVAIAVVTLAACFDRTTAPPPALAPVPRHDFLGDGDWGANNSAASGSYDGTIDRVYGGAPPAAQALGPIVYPTFITANVSGQVQQVPGAVQGSNIVREAWSTNDPAFWGSMGFRSNGDVWWPVGPSAILRVVAPIAPFRNDAGGQPTGDWSHCGWAGYALCWTWAGTAHFDFQRIHVDLTLARSPDTTVWQGTAATFTAGMSQTTFPGNPYPVDMSALQWRWISDSTASDSVACQSTSGKTCTHVFTSSGTMYTAAYVNGEAQQKSIHVQVKVPSLQLTAQKMVMAAPGEMDSFFPLGNGAVVVQGWSFTPEVGGAAPIRTETTTGSLSTSNAVRSSLPRPATRSVMSRHTAAAAQQRAPASRSPRLAGTSRQFAAPDGANLSVSVGSTWGDCVASASPCTAEVTESGTVEVIGTVNGVQLTASVHVSVVPCPTGDTLLDQSNIRADLMNMMARSNPDSAAGAGMDSTHLSGAKREQGLWIYKRDDGTFFSIPIPDTSADECHIDGWPAPEDPPHARLWAAAHSHPGDDGKPVYGRCPVKDPKGNIYSGKRFPGDTSGVQGYKKDDYSQGGGSDADWGLTIKGVHVYVMNKKGEIWKLPAYTPDRDRLKNRDERRHLWKGNSDPACNWP
jgi:hypothetical protein